MKRKLLIVAAALLLAIGAWAADTAPAPAAKTVTVDASNTPVDQVLKDIAAGTGETVLAEKLVTGNVTAKVKDATAETALDAVAKSLHLQWRKIYVAKGSVFAKDADALAAQMRTVLALRFPDIAISPSGSGGSFVHVQKQTSADEIIKALPTTAGLQAVYLVTDDKKAYEKELKDESKKKVADYVKANQEMIEQFLAMSPEERKAVLRESMSVIGRIGPEGMGEMIRSMFELDPEYISEMNRLSMQAFLGMDPGARKNMLRMSIQQQMDLMKSMTPEQLQQFQQEISAITSEISGGGSGGPEPGPPPGQ